MNTVDLSVLIQAHQSLEMLREVAEDSLTTEQYMRALRASSRLGAEIEMINMSVKVEVTA